MSLTDVVFESTNDGLVLLDAHLTIQRSNRVARQLLRRPDTDMHGLSIWDIIPRDPSTTIEATLLGVLQRQIASEVDVFYPTLYVWHELRVAPAPEGLLLIMRDITDRQWLLRKDAERAYLRNLFEDAPVAISLARGRDLRYDYLNRTARQLIHGRVVEGKTPHEAFPEPEFAPFHALMEQVYTTGEPYQAIAQPTTFDRRGDGQLEDTYFTFMYQPIRGFDAQVSGVLTITFEVPAPAEGVGGV